MALRHLVWVLLGLVLSVSAGWAEEPPRAFTADAHKSLGFSCTDCHGTEKPQAPQSVATQQCLTCHKSFEALGKKTADMEPNPHANHLISDSDVECGQCHQGHKADQLTCTQCHADLTFKRHRVASAPTPRGAAPATPPSVASAAFGALFYVAPLVMVVGLAAMARRRFRRGASERRPLGETLRATLEAVLDRRWFRDAPLTLVFRLLFWAGLALVLARHLRYAIDPAWVGGGVWRAVEIVQPFGFYGGIALIVGGLGLVALRLLSGPASAGLLSMPGLRLALCLAVPVTGYAAAFRHGDVLQAKAFFVGLITGHWTGLPGDPLVLLHLWLAALLMIVLPFGRALAPATPLGRKLRIVPALLVVLAFIPAALAVHQSSLDGWGQAPKPDFATLVKQHATEPPSVMIRNHTAFLMMQKDAVLHQGTRVPGDTLERCVTCHVKKDEGGLPVGFQSPDHFCTACHTKVAVTTDCFECHNSKPQSTRPTAATILGGSKEQ